MTRLSRRICRLASVGAGLISLYGCATHRAEVPSTTAGPHITVRPGRAGLVVAAPPATSDADTGDMTAEIARRTGFGLVVTLPGRPVAGSTERARAVAESYERSVREAAQGPLRFYAEIHGNARQQCAGELEIATVGVDRELALRLRALAELIRDAYLRAHREVQRLDVLVAPVDAVTDQGSGAGRDGILRLPERALQIELPRCERRDWRDTYTSILADFLAQAVTLSAGR
jgi:hypothetical protein